MTLAVSVTDFARNTFISLFVFQIVKFDADTKQQIEWSGGDGFASEPVFIPRPDAVDEDDGKLLSFIKHNLICLCFWPN